ncbi:MAG: ABC transporter permease [Gemmataceae bacterium]
MITARTLPFRNLRYHWRSNLPVLLGTLIGAAVLTGALLVGDSLRLSLGTRVDRQLNGVNAAWIGQRFIKTEASKIDGDKATPIILLQGTVECEGRRATQVTVVGLPTQQSFFPSVKLNGAGAVLSNRLAEKLDAKSGNDVRILVEKPSAIPRGSLLSKRDLDDATLSVRSPIAGILPASDPANEFSLHPTPGLPLVVYLPLELLQQRIGQAGKCNALLSRDASTDELNRVFAANLTLADWGLSLRTERTQPAPKKVKERELPYVSIESDRLVIDAANVNAVMDACNKLGLRAEKTTSYLANAILANGKEVPYSIVTSLNPSASAPLGPFLPTGKTTLADDEMVLVDWPESPLKAVKVGEEVTVRFFAPEVEGGAKENSATFKLAGRFPLAGAAADPSLTPPFAGITDKLSVRDWKPPFPYDSSKIKANDIHERFWQDYRTTPKAYLNAHAAETYFASRYGVVTSVRVAPKAGETCEATAEKLKAELLKTLDPRVGGFVFENVAERMRAAGKGGQDFGGLFLGFSFFLIGSALLLIGLLFRLAMERRAREVGLLLASGFSPRQVRRLLMFEGGGLAALGSLLGAVLAVPYATWLLQILVSLWPDRSLGSFLSLHVTPLSLAIGWAAGLLTALVAMWLAIRGLVKVSCPQLLRGVSSEERSNNNWARSSLWKWLPVSFTLPAVILLFLGVRLTDPDAKAGCFFGSGAMFLFEGILMVRLWLLRSNPNSSLQNLRQFAIRNATRNPGRSLLTVSLVASASFLLIAVESFRRPAPPADWKTYSLIAETDVPLYQSFDSGPGWDDLLLGLEKSYADRPTEESTSARLAKATATLKGLEVVPIRVHRGDDASCLNLYQAGKPKVIGVPASVLPEMKPDGSTGIPTAVEQNTMMWMLKTSLGSMIEIPGGNGTPVDFRLKATLTDSPFQSELLVSTDDFRKAFPHEDGYRAFLIRPSSNANMKEVASLLETGFSSAGMTVTPIQQKIISYQAVIGAYLTLFQLLGGFGLLLGIAGLAIVLIRGVWERSGEFALLQSVGFTPSQLMKLVLIENILLLVQGLAVGIIAAVISVFPHHLDGGTIPWLRLTVLLGSVLLAGVITAAIATRFAVRQPVIPSLRAE